MDSRKLDLNLLTALEALLAEHNVTRAAQRLNISQPAMSAQLARLRDLFGDRLFVPTSRGMIATRKAQELETPLRDALDQLRQLIARSATFDPSSSVATVTVAASDYVQIAVLLPFIAFINQSAPGLRIRLKLLDITNVSDEMRRGDLDLAFLQSKDAATYGLLVEKAFDEDYVGIGRRGTLGAVPMDMDRFTNARHIIVSRRSQGFSGPTDDALATAGYSRRVVFAVSSFVLLTETVATTDLLAIAPKRLAEHYADRLDIFDPPLPIPGFSISLAWHQSTDGHPALEWIKTQLAIFSGPSLKG